MACNFTFAHYGEILRKALDEGYAFHTFSGLLDARPQGRVMVLRHDVDSHLQRAAEFSRIEASLGVKATYFIRAHTAYNPFEYNNFKVLAGIMAAGHEVGLHAEMGDFAKFNPGATPEEYLSRAKKFLEACIGVPVKGVSPHRDLDYQVNSLPILEAMDFRALGFNYHSYEDVFVKECKYVSETLSPHISWREGCPCGLLGKFGRICLMTHPRWWFHSHPREGEFAWP